MTEIKEEEEEETPQSKKRKIELFSRLPFEIIQEIFLFLVIDVSKILNIDQRLDDAMDESVEIIKIKRDTEKLLFARDDKITRNIYLYFQNVIYSSERLDRWFFPKDIRVLDYFSRTTTEFKIVSLVNLKYLTIRNNVFSSFVENIDKITKLPYILRLIIYDFSENGMNQITNLFSINTELTRIEHLIIETDPRYYYDNKINLERINSTLLPPFLLKFRGLKFLELKSIVPIISEKLKFFMSNLEKIVITGPSNIEKLNLQDMMMFEYKKLNYLVLLNLKLEFEKKIGVFNSLKVLGIDFYNLHFFKDNQSIERLILNVESISVEDLENDMQKIESFNKFEKELTDKALIFRNVTEIQLLMVVGSDFGPADYLIGPKPINIGFGRRKGFNVTVRKINKVLSFIFPKLKKITEQSEGIINIKKIF
jgi:hypothetical protein